MSNDSGVKISKELQLMLNKHFNRVYLFVWVYGLIKTYKSKKMITSIIEHRFNDYCRRHINGDLKDKAGIEKYKSGISEFLKDFSKLNHSEIALLNTMKMKEAISFPIISIGNKIILKEE